MCEFKLGVRANKVLTYGKKIIQWTLYNIFVYPVASISSFFYECIFIIT